MVTSRVVVGNYQLLPVVGGGAVEGGVVVQVGVAVFAAGRAHAAQAEAEGDRGHEAAGGQRGGRGKG